MSKKIQGELRRFIDDPQYPRPFVLRVARQVIRFWWLTVVFYVTNVLPDVVKLVANAGVVALADIDTLAHLLLVEPLLHLWKREPARFYVIIFGVILLALGLTLGGYYANEDYQREQRILRARELLDVARFLQTSGTSSLSEAADTPQG